MKSLKENLRLLLPAAMLLPAIASSAQQVPDSAAFAQAVKSIAPVTLPQSGTGKIIIPAAPAGYQLLLKGSDRNPVIDSLGKITTPLNDAVVSLYFVLRRTQDGAEMDAPQQLTVPGKYGKQEADQPTVIPALREWHSQTGTYALSGTTNIVIDPAFAKELSAGANIFLEDLQTITHSHTHKIILGKPAKGDIYLTLNTIDKSLGKEGYMMQIDDQITINALHQQGAFWATRTILQLLEQDITHRNIRKGITRDYPKYAIRSFVLDDGRKLFTLDFVRHYVKFMAYYKMNDFHIHLNDNGFVKFFGDNWDSTYSAFRLENKTYPGLTAKDGFYTKQQFIDLQSLADSLSVTIIPEIDVPAHSLAFSKANPAVASTKYGRDHLNLDPVSWEMVDNVFKEYLEGPNPVFKGAEVHIGTDEYAKEESEKFRAFTDHLIKFVEGYGKKVRMWGSLTHAQGKTPVKSEGVTMNAWYNGYAEPREMIRQGYDLISTPDGWLYIVPAAGYYYDYLDIKKIYEKWEPNMIGNVTFPYGHPKIKGGAFAEWNDHCGNGITQEDVHDRVFPAMQVLAEKMWTGHTTISNYDKYEQLSKLIGEGPGLNMRGKYTGKDSLLLSYNFEKGKATDISGNNRNAIKSSNAKIGSTLKLNGGNSYISTPLATIGYDYTVSFDINPAENNAENAVIFSGPVSVVKLKQGSSGKLGFSREGYNYFFDYVVPANTWTHIEISGNNKGTALFVNGKLVQRLQDEKITFPNTKDKNAKVQTLVFPLQLIGATANAFNGEIDNLKVYNYAK
ncbi:family 20 glycosylhydrolase [Chitinophaga sp. Cy-1792]|uniref:family 20 glycosylhydrolase n=1 Tax=Chitinophaga sp. Cy-1792 TaxID=2608339 RepID=UPI00141E9AF9|nr:family 20 glycosylhydrolase [Chitinophaga sp. Cy-1792]NIG53179.1 family 20 glycosylhydrolase [Chitinophaga sp. Cy-1792]